MPLVGSRLDVDCVEISWFMPMDAATAWHYATKSKNLPIWLGIRRSGYMVTGETVVVQHRDGRLCTSTIDHVVAGRELGMTWQFEGEGQSYVVLKITPRDGGARLRLTHSSLVAPAEYFDAWNASLTRLEKVLQRVAAGSHPLLTG